VLTLVLHLLTKTIVFIQEAPNQVRCCLLVDCTNARVKGLAA